MHHDFHMLSCYAAHSNAASGFQGVSPFKFFFCRVTCQFPKPPSSVQQGFEVPVVESVDEIVCLKRHRTSTGCEPTADLPATELPVGLACQSARGPPNLKPRPGICPSLKSVRPSPGPAVVVDASARLGSAVTQSRISRTNAAQLAR
jgi:hypothetical protein